MALTLDSAGNSMFLLALILLLKGWFIVCAFFILPHIKRRNKNGWILAFVTVSVGTGILLSSFWWGIACSAVLVGMTRYSLGYAIDHWSGFAIRFGQFCGAVSGACLLKVAFEVFPWLVWVGVSYVWFRAQEG